MEKAFHWYRDRSPTAAMRFLDAVDEAIGKITAAPLSFPLVAVDCRRCRLKRYPFDIVYRLLEDAIAIVAIAHSKRRPNHWRRRL